MKQRLLAVSVLLLTFYSGFGQAWAPIKNAPVVKYRFDDIYFINDSTGWAVDGNGNIYKTSVIGQPWINQFNTERYNRAIEFIDDTTGFVGSVDSAVYMTTNAGEDWHRIDHQFPIGIPGVCGISHLGNAVLLTGTYYASPFIMRSPDRGVTWFYTDMSPYCNGLVDAWYKTADTVFVSGRSDNSRGIILRSADGGISWSVMTESNVPTGYAWKLHFPTSSVGYVSLEEVTPNDGLIGNKTHILKTINGGNSWVVKEVKIDKNIDFQGMGFISANRGWIGGWSTGMYETNDGAETWKLVKPYANLNRFFFLRPDFGYVSGTTIFQFNKGVVTGLETPTAASHDVHTMEIYPNPTHRETNVKVTLGNYTMMVIEVYDVQGRLIKEISRGYQDAGDHQYPLDMKDLPAGEYVIVLLTHEHFLGRKLIKLKN